MIITDLPNTLWRDALMPAHFDGKLFHVDTGSRESGRRIVVHEFPKKEDPYSEDMGKRAVAFSVRGYCIVYPHDDPSAPSLYQRDYRIARKALQDRLETGGPGVLQLPTLAPMMVKCQRYRLTEDEKLGGYCVFDMQFVEAGVQPFMPQTDTAENLYAQSDVLKNQVASVWAAQRAPVGPQTAIRMQLISRWTGPATNPVRMGLLNRWIKSSSASVVMGPLTF
jgi:prophage DNA circulation protein